MLEVVKNQKVKENEIEEVKKVKKEFTISPKVIKRVLLSGVGAELLALSKIGYNFYKSGVGMSLNLPYCSGMVIPYWFLALAITAPIIPKIVNKGVEIIVVNSNDESNDKLTKLIASMTKGKDDD